MQKTEKYKDAKEYLYNMDDSLEIMKTAQSFIDKSNIDLIKMKGYLTNSNEKELMDIFNSIKENKDLNKKIKASIWMMFISLTEEVITSEIMQKVNLKKNSDAFKGTEEFLNSVAKELIIDSGYKMNPEDKKLNLIIRKIMTEEYDRIEEGMKKGFEAISQIFRNDKGREIILDINALIDKTVDNKVKDEILNKIEIYGLVLGNNKDLKVNEKVMILRHLMNVSKVLEDEDINDSLYKAIETVICKEKNSANIMRNKR